MKSIGSSRVGNNVTFCLPGVGNRPPKKKKIENPGGVPGGDGMVTNQIELRITWQKLCHPWSITLSSNVI